MAMITRNELAPTEYGAFYANYLAAVPGGHTVAEALRESGSLLQGYLSEVTPDREDFRYAPGKWTVKEALRHVIDTERVFAYRILRLGRRDPTPLPGFDQNVFAEAADVSRTAFADLRAEFDLVRRSTLELVRSMGEEDLVFVGTASGYPLSCRAMAFIAAGHTYHHLTVYRERYAAG